MEKNYQKTQNIDNNESGLHSKDELNNPEDKKGSEPLEYFQGLLSSIPIRSLEKSSQKLKNMSVKMQRGLVEGDIRFNEYPSQVDNIIRIKKQIEDKRTSLATQLQKFNMIIDIQNNSKLFRKSSKSENKFNVVKRAHTQAISQQELMKVIEKRRAAHERLRGWKKRKQDVMHIRQNTETSRKLKAQQIERSIKLTLLSQQQQHKKTKKEAIIAKLKEINQRKMQRSQILKRSKTQKSHTLPKYILSTQKYENSEKLREHERFEIKKLMRKKLEQEYDSERIKEHQKLYKKMLSSRIKTQTKTDCLQTCKSNLQRKFKIMGRNQQQVEAQKQRADRRSSFHKRQKQIPIKASLVKMIEACINKDKAKNPRKYHFLSEKALDDLCIFSEFQDFEVPQFDRKELGNQYLDQLKDKLNNSRTESKSTVRRVKTITTESGEQRKQYKNYLKELKFKQPRKLTQIQKIIQQNTNKSKVVDKLRIQSNKHQNRVIQKIFQLKKIDNYAESLQKEDQIDLEYIQSLKARVACLQIQQ